MLLSALTAAPPLSPPAAGQGTAACKPSDLRQARKRAAEMFKNKAYGDAADLLEGIVAGCHLAMGPADPPDPDFLWLESDRALASFRAGNVPGCLRVAAEIPARPDLEGLPAYRALTHNKELCEKAAGQPSSSAPQYRTLRTQELTALNPVDHTRQRTPGSLTSSAVGYRLNETLVKAEKAAMAEPCFTLAQEQWALVRDRGRWLMRAALLPSEKDPRCQGQEKIFDVPGELPPELTGGDALPVPFATLAKAKPGLLDAAASPDGRLMLLIHADRVALEVDGKQMGTYPGHFSLVMATWLDAQYLVKGLGTATVVRH